MTINSERNPDDTQALSTDRRTLLGTMGAAGIGSVAGCGSQNGDGSTQQTEPVDSPQQSQAGPQGEGAPGEGFADRVIINAKVVTLDVHEINDDPGTVAEAVAVKDGEFISVGGTGDMGKFVGDDTEVVDMGGKTILPGFCESHIHPSGGIEDAAPNLFQVPGLHMSMLAERTPEATLEKMRSFMSEVTPREDEWIFFNVEPNPDIPEVDSIIKLTRWTKRNAAVEELEINKHDINELAPDNPMLAAISGGRTPSIAQPGQIIRLERSGGEVTTTFIVGEEQSSGGEGGMSRTVPLEGL